MEKTTAVVFASLATLLLMIPLISAPELIYDDFNDETLGTNTGGAAGAMSYDGNHDPTISFVQGYEGRALALTYNLPQNQWAGYWSFFQSDEGGYDLRGYTDLQMWVRGASGGEIFKVEMKDTNNRYRAIYVTLVPGFESGATTSWQKLVIPLYNFASVMDLGNVKQLNIVFDRAPWQGTVHLDKITFTTDSPARSLPAGLIVDDYNDGSGPNNLGGGCGIMDPDPNGGPEWITEEYVGGAYEGLGCLKLTYNRGTSSWVGYWSFLHPDQHGIDVSGYKYLSMYVKGASGGESFRVELKDSSNKVSKQVISGITSSWKEFRLDLSGFSGVSLTSLAMVNFVMDLPPNSGTVYIDLVRFIRENENAPQQPVDNTIVRIFPENQNVRTGENFSVQIGIIPVTGVAGVQCTLRFNPQILGVLDVTEGDFLKQGGASSFFQVISLDNTTGKIEITGVRINGSANSPGVFATVQLKAKDNQGTSQLWLEDVILGDENGQVLPVTLRGAVVSVEAYAPWDVNQDGKVNIQDMLAVISKWKQTGPAGWIAEDINKDGKINVLDLILIGQHWTG
ncbi:MAG: cohesin domain-containing protein [Candidatus Hadarchaeales archaeon]